jgi:hypothetical protein
MLLATTIVLSERLNSVGGFKGSLHHLVGLWNITAR